MAASGAVPSSLTTPSSIGCMACAVCAEITRRCSGAGAGSSRPSPSATPLTRVGAIRTPSLATVCTTEATCSAVTDTPCPIGMVPSEEPDQSAGSGTSPADSPGSPMPVLAPNPNARM